MPTYPDVKLFINGTWRDGKAGKSLPVIDPATEEEIGRLAMAGTADLDEALAAAEKGFAIWRATPAFDRYQIMRKAANILRERADDSRWPIPLARSCAAPTPSTGLPKKPAAPMA